MTNELPVSRRRRSRIRAVAAVVASLAVAAGLAACASSGGKTTASSGSCAKTYNLRYGDAAPTVKDPEAIVGQDFISSVEKNSGGCIKIKYFPNSELGVSTTLLTGVLNGSVDFASVTTGTVAGRDPKFFAFGLPFMSATHDDLYKIFRSSVGQQILQDLKPKGATGLFFNDDGPFVFTFADHVTGPSGFNGKKIRAYPDALNNGVVQKLGARPVPLDFPQVYSSLQSGVINGVEASPTAFASAKLQEVAKYALLVVPDWTSAAVFVANKTLNSLPANLQKAVTDAAKTAQDQADQATATSLTAAKTNLVAAGFQVEAPTDFTPYSQAVAGLLATYTTKVGADIVTQVKAAVGQS